MDDRNRSTCTQRGVKMSPIQCVMGNGREGEQRKERWEQGAQRQQHILYWNMYTLSWHFLKGSHKKAHLISMLTYSVVDKRLKQHLYLKYFGHVFRIPLYKCYD